MEKKKVNKIELSRIIAKNLFGYVNYDLKDLDKNPVNFIISQNGMGKTTTLNLLNDLSTRKFTSFYHTKFDKLFFSFKLTYTGPLNEEKFEEISSLVFIKDNNDNVSWCRLESIDNISFDNISLNPMPHGLAAQRTIDDKVKWFVENSKELKNKVKLEPCKRHYSVNGNGHHSAEKVLSIIETEMNEILSQYTKLDDFKFLDDWNVFLIPYDRIKEEQLSKENLWVVEKIRTDMIVKMRTHVVNVSDTSKIMEDQNIDNLINNKQSDEIDLEDTVKKINQLEKRLEQYQLISKVNPIKTKLSELEGIKREALKIVLKNRLDKIKAHEKFLNRLDLFQNLLSDLFVFKNVKTDIHFGIQIIVNNKNTIPLRNLSTGEQHFLILVYKIFFEIPRDSCVLIDEPETSLHLVWQERLISSLEQIHKDRNVNFICATHSPAFIGQRHSMMKPIGPIQ